MGRSLINRTTIDATESDSNVLFSFIKGEALEFPVTLSFLEEISVATGYTLEAVIVEGDNKTGQTSYPDSAKIDGVQTVLNIRLPNKATNWNPLASYDVEYVVFYNSKFYKLRKGSEYVSALTPDVDANWVETVDNVIYVQFPSTIASSWTVQPTVSSSVYGFFELRVTEPANPIFQRTWKPVRGVVEILFSPTDVVPG